MARDYLWGIRRLEAFVESATRFRSADERDDAFENVAASQETVKTIVRDLVPDARWPALTDADQSGGPVMYKTVDEQRTLAFQALGAAKDAEQLEEHWPSEPAVEMNPAELHPWVWDAARGLWDDDHWGEAVEAAAKVINTKLQSRTKRRDLTGTDLVRQAFSLSPPTSENPRLRVITDDGSQTYRSAQEGAMHLGEALTMYWRNVLSHEPGGAPRQPATEALAAMSAFARLVDESTVVTD